MIKKHNLICFSFMPWSDMWKRNQSMMAEIANFEFIEKVIFVNPDISFRHIINLRRIKTNKLFPDQFKLRKIQHNIWIYTLVHLLPVSFQTKFFERIESSFHLKRLLRLNNQTPYILFMNCPNIIYTYPIDELLKKAALSIFDFSDDFIELVHTKERKALYARNIEKYARAADIIFTVNDHLKNKYRSINQNIYVVKNGTNYYNFQRKEYKVVPLLEEIKNNNQPIIGYSGIVNITRIDTNIIEFLLRSKPEWQFVFVGPQGKEVKALFSQHPNFTYLCAVEYQSFPDYLNYFDVAIVPFKINAHTKGNNLLKLHDYFAMGKPIVTTNIGGAEDFKDILRIANSPSGFLKEIENSMINNSPQLVQKRKKTALINSWPYRIKKVKNIIDSLI